MDDCEVSGKEQKEQTLEKRLEQFGAGQFSRTYDFFIKIVNNYSICAQLEPKSVNLGSDWKPTTILPEEAWNGEWEDCSYSTDLKYSKKRLLVKVETLSQHQSTRARTTAQHLPLP